MGIGDFGRFIQAELDAIAEFRKAESQRQGRDLSEDEAAQLWVDKHAAQFRCNYEDKDKGADNG